MSVTNGQSANQTTFNNAFMSRTANTSTVGKIDLSNADSVSGSAIVNIQRELNSLSSFSGKSINVAKDNKPAWVSTAVGASGDNLFQRAEALTTKFGTGVLVTTGGQTFTGDKTFSDDITASGVINVAIEVDSSTTGATATFATPSRTIRKLTNASLDSIAGITAPTAAQLLVIINDKPASQITVLEESSSATAANRIRTGTGDVTLQVGQSLLLVYDTNESRWQVIGGTGGGDQLYQIYDLNVYGKEGYGPIEGFDSSGFFKTFTFEKGSSQVMVLAGRVPQDFVSGSQLYIRGHVKSSSGTGNIYLTITGTLYRGATSETVVFNKTVAVTTNLTTFSAECSTSDGRLNDYIITYDDFMVWTVERTVDNVADTLANSAIIAVDSLEVAT